MKVGVIATEFSNRNKKKIASLDDEAFSEFTVGYYFIDEWTERRMKPGDTEESSIVEKQQHSKNWISMNNDKIIFTKEQRKSVPVERRGITLRQLRAIKENIKRRCIPEQWTNLQGKKLTPETVCLYDVNKYIIMPYTETTRMAFVPSLPSTTGPQPPKWFASHWWGEPFFEFVNCVECFVMDFRDIYHRNRGVGMNEDTPIWVCAFANNQWDLGETITDNPFDSGFTLALEEADYRTLTILDKDGTVFNRIWCILELYLTFLHSNNNNDDAEIEKSTKGMWTVYTACDSYISDGWGKLRERFAVGLASNREIGHESMFPLDLVAKSLEVEIEKASASVASDRLHILNAIVGNTQNLDATPPETHNEYAVLNNAVVGAFASSMSLLRTASQHENKNFWNKMISKLSTAKRRGRMRLAFDQWKLSENEAVELISKLPLTTDKLEIDHCPYGYRFAVALADWIRKAKNLKSFWIRDACFASAANDDGGRDAGIKLAEAFGDNRTIKAIRLWGTDLIGARNAPDWAGALAKNSTLEVFLVQGFGLRLPSYAYDKEFAKINTYVDEDRKFLVRDGMLFNEGYFALAEGIGRSKSLKVIGLEFHGASREGIISFGPALMRNETITKVCIDEGYESRKTAMKGIRDLRMYVNFVEPPITFPKYISYVERDFDQYY